MSGRPKGLTDLWAASTGRVHFDVVIVGSGYGGSIAAAELAGATVDDGRGGRRPLRVCVLERGRVFKPGEFPTRLPDLIGQVRVGLQANGMVAGAREGLLDVRVGGDVSALVANGLGGGSLINAGVLMAPPVSEFAPGSVLHGLVRHLRGRGWYARARRLLGALLPVAGRWRPNTIARHAAFSAPGAPVAPTKGLAMRTLAAQGGYRGRAPAISVAMVPGVNSGGLTLPACTLCGDCLTGCNVGAKDSLDANLLERALRGGVDIVTGASVVSLARETAPDGGREWSLQVIHTEPALQARETAALDLRADKVILSAGALGSTEILLRSRTRGLAFSPRLGTRFSCNGDDISAVHRLPVPVGGTADPSAPLDARGVGPTITTSARVPYPVAEGAPAGAARQTFRLQEFAVPGAFAGIFAQAVTMGATLQKMTTADHSRHGVERPGALDPAALDPAALGHSIVIGTIGHDTADGLLSLAAPLAPVDRPAEPGALAIHWPGAHRGRHIRSAQDTLAGIVDLIRSEGDSPTLVPNPMWSPFPADMAAAINWDAGTLLTVHPLGGCAIGRDVDDGVVDASGRVFDATHGRGGARPDQPPDAWFGSLAVLDGAIIPGSLGANPALTIAATALRAMTHLKLSWRVRTAVPLMVRKRRRVRTAQQPVPAARAMHLPWSARPPLPHRPRPVLPLPAGRPGTPGVPGVATQVAILERLRGPVTLATSTGTRLDCIVELTLAYRPAVLTALMSTMHRQVTVDPADPRTRLRIFDARQWERLGLNSASDAARMPLALVEAELSGDMTFLHREESWPLPRMVRAVAAWVRNRGIRDTFFGNEPTSLTTRLRRIGQVRGLASRAGEARLFEYRLAVGTVLALRAHPQHGLLPIATDGRIVGGKRFTYDRRANPWRQLMRMHVTQMPGLARRDTPSLWVDLRYFAESRQPLVRIVAQQDLVQAMADLAAFGLYIARLLLTIHFWSFRLPDPPRAAEPVRLPVPLHTALPTMLPHLPDPDVVEIEVDRVRTARLPDGSKMMVPIDLLDNETRVVDEPVNIRLTRYRRNDFDVSRAPEARPLLMIHGYSASGTTFAHPAIPVSAAQWFAMRGRDVWVLDLRTSAGMPHARLPWAMEQAALIDIPAAVRHVHGVTGRKVDVLAHCIGAVMISQALLSDVTSPGSAPLRLGSDVWFTETQLGRLAEFNRRATPDAAHPYLGRVVLSQKGPVLDYTDANVFRAWAMQHMRQLFDRVVPDYQFRPDGRGGPPKPSPVIDRLLSTVPYPDEDYDIDNPLTGHQSWSVNRHRSDALFARSLDARNVDRRTLEAIDDLYGTMSMATMAQPIQFARFKTITTFDGNGPYVTVDRMRAGWAGIPTLAIHGRNNGMADVATQALLSSTFHAAQLPFYAQPSDQAPFDTLGHQDCMVGRHAARVFEVIAEFLDKPLAAVQAVADGQRAEWVAQAVAAEPPGLAAAALGWQAAVPWVGPRIDLPDRDEGGPYTVGPGAVRIAAMPRPDCGTATLWLVPAIAHPAAPGGTGGLTLLPGAPVIGDSGGAGTWLFAKPDPATLTDAAPAPGGAAGWLAVLVYATGEVNPVALDYPAGAQALLAAATLPPPPVAARLAATGASPRVWLAPIVAASADDWWRAFVPHRTVAAAVADMACQTGRIGFSFALGSCQYPGGVYDAELSGGSLEAMARAADALPVRRHEAPAPRPDAAGVPDAADAADAAKVADAADAANVADAAAEPVTLALMVGDQIYADATAGLADPLRPEELFDARSETALRTDAMRAVLRSVPVRMLLDDHEIFDNWCRPSAGVALARPLEARLRDYARKYGWRAYARLQRMRPDLQMPADLGFRFGGHPFWLADSRTQRASRDAGALPLSPRMLSFSQLAELQAFLLAHREVLKFVATPSLFLPRRGGTREQPHGCLRSDAWDGYPGTHRQLIDFIAHHEIRNTVFLSGDEHHSLFAQAWFTASSGQCVSVLSVHGSALYAPIPFANGAPEDFEAIDAFTTGTTRVRVATTFAPPGNGFVRISVLTPVGADARLRIEFDRAGRGRSMRCLVRV